MVERNVIAFAVREFDFSGMEIKWGSRCTATEHEKAVEWEEEASLLPVSVEHAEKGALCCYAKAAHQQGEYAHTRTK